MAPLRRLDAELVRRGLARSRADACDLIAAGQVRVGGITALKAARQVAAAESVSVTRASELTWASRGGNKLADALADLRGLDVSGSNALDAGASTGGFTDVLLAHGATHVVALDVGRGQLIWRLRDDPRVTAIDRCNIRSVTPADLPYPPDLIVADLSFISLRTVLPALAGVAAPSADFVLLVKPQFEVGRGNVGKGGVVVDPEQRSGAVSAVARRAAELGLGCLGVAASRHPGAAGNVEFFLWLHAGSGGLGDDGLARAIAAATGAGDETRGWDSDGRS